MKAQNVLHSLRKYFGWVLTLIKPYTNQWINNDNDSNYDKGDDDNQVYQRWINELLAVTG